MKKKSCWIGWLALVLVCALTACSQQVEVNKNIELQTDEIKENSFELTEVSRDTVEQVMHIQCTYNQIEETELAFQVDREVITEVLVEKGDSVKKGDILASVNVESTEEKAEQLRYQLSLDELSLKQLKEKRDFELEQTQIYYEGYLTKEEQEKLPEELEKVRESYENRIRNYEDTIYIAKKRLQEYEEYVKNGKLLAPMDGIISHVKSNLKDSLTTKGETIMRLYDPASKMYYSDDVEAIPHIQEGEQYTIVCGLGNRKREYIVEPANMENWGELMYFRLLDEDFDPNNVVSGKITLVLEEKEDALCVSYKAIHSSEDKYYVYTLDENNVRRMQFIEVGLWGDEQVEILSGLSEGDRVIMR